MRQLRHIAIVFSLCLAAAAAVLWVRGIGVRDELSMPLGTRKCIITTYPHHVWILLSSRWYVRDSGQSPVQLTLGREQYGAGLGWWAPRFGVGSRSPGGDSSYEASIPYWLLVLMGMVLPASWLRARRRTRRLLRAGLCPSCGYDLRATPDRCPECGSVSSPTEAAA